jgi:hypothetical protein
LLEKTSTYIINGREIKKKEYFFDPDAVPVNFKYFIDQFPDYRVGVTNYTGVFTNEELLNIGNLKKHH